MKESGYSFKEVHWPLCGVVVLLGVLGVYNLHSSAAAHEPGLYLVQLGIFGAGCVLVALATVVDYHITETLAYPLFVLACLLLCIVLWQGNVAYGARRWLSFGVLRFQPSEPAKLALIFCLARFFGQRIETQGYTMRSLFRPLNPSRPLAALMALILLWKNPWLGDPIGQLARLIRSTMGGVFPSVDDLLWFRLFMMMALSLVCASGLWVIIRVERERALLDPWPQGYRNRLMGMWFGLCLMLLALLITNWNAPFVRDPFGFLLLQLYHAAGPGQVFAILNPGLGLRLPLTISVLFYLFAAAWNLWRHAPRARSLLIAPIDLVVIPALLIVVEPDLGTAGIVTLIGFTVILVVGVRLRTLVTMGFLGACVSMVAWFGMLKDYQKRRILTFIDPEHDIQGAGWNAVQSMIAVGSGRFRGKGHLEGTQTQLSFLPEQHTDFAFSVWAEEQGFLGCLVVLLLYALLFGMALAIAANARDTYGALVATGVAALIFWQTFINIGMVIGLLPVVGVTLPMFSYGGSSLLSVMLGVGMLLNIHMRRRPHATHALGL